MTEKQEEFFYYRLRDKGMFNLDKDVLNAIDFYTAMDLISLYRSDEETFWNQFNHIIA